MKKVKLSKGFHKLKNAILRVIFWIWASEVISHYCMSVLFKVKKSLHPNGQSFKKICKSNLITVDLFKDWKDWKIKDWKIKFPTMPNTRFNASFYYYSWGTGCGKKGLPGVYTDVYHFITSQDKWLCNALNLKNACPKKVICWCLSFHNQPGQMAMQSFKPVEFMSLERNLLIS